MKAQSAIVHHICTHFYRMNYLSVEQLAKSFGIQVLFENLSFGIEKGQKVAQAVLCPVVAGKWVNLIEYDEIDSKDRSDNGFGSTGI